MPALEPYLFAYVVELWIVAKPSYRPFPVSVNA